MQLCILQMNAECRFHSAFMLSRRKCFIPYHSVLAGTVSLSAALSIASLWQLSPAVCLQDTMPIEDKMALRMTAIDQVLGTDMKKHFSILSRFQVSCIPCLAPLPVTCYDCTLLLGHIIAIGITYLGHHTPHGLLLSIAFTKAVPPPKHEHTGGSSLLCINHIHQTYPQRRYRITCCAD